MQYNYIPLRNWLVNNVPSRWILGLLPELYRITHISSKQIIYSLTILDFQMHWVILKWPEAAAAEISSPLQEENKGWTISTERYKRVTIPSSIRSSLRIKDLTWWIMKFMYCTCSLTLHYWHWCWYDNSRQSQDLLIFVFLLKSENMKRNPRFPLCKVPVKMCKSSTLHELQEIR